MPSAPEAAAFADHLPEETFISAWRARLTERLAERRITPRQLGRLLGLRNATAARRRLRGETHFTAYEVLRLSQAFGLPTDPRALVSPTLGLRLGSPLDEEFSADRLVASVLAIAKSLLAPDHLDRDAAAPTYYVSTTDLPFAYLCAYPRLAALRLFSLEGGGGRRDVDFDYARMRVQRRGLFAGIAEVAALHGASDNVEVWSANPLASLLATVEVLRKRNALSEAFTAEVFDDLDALIDDIRLAAKTGAKPGGGRFELYEHDLATRTTDVVVVGPQVRLTIHTLRHPHFAVSEDAATAGLFLELFERLRREATLIDGRAPYRYRGYADGLRAAVAAAR